MASPRWPAVLHEGDMSRDIEVSADTRTLILHLDATRQRWPFAETKFRSGGVPRFEHGESLLIVNDPQIVKSIEMLNPAAVDAMEKSAAGAFTGRDFLSALLAVLIVMGIAAAVTAAVWLLR